ncbi:MAG: hypothetical protein OYI31_03905 [Chloroflexota bacterium]|nr:hypothetical protein [Chloroflexota bacterium]MDE2940819.1 hypothetical protein [Chloroflexota bacterium]MDE3267591.1 hypothetical protein [Chloroflexota bacterium]
MIKKLMTRTFLVGPALAALLGAGILVGCTTGENGTGEGRESGTATESQEVSEQGRGESSGEHGSGGEGTEGGGEGAGGESGGEGAGSGSEEGSGANQLAPDETFDMVRSGARLILSYDAASNSFKGTVENTTNSVLTRIRIEVHLSNGTELGPTTPIDLAPGEVAAVDLPSTQASFIGWVAHAEVGSGSEGSGTQASGEGSGGESGGEGSGSEGANEGPEGTESGGMGAEAGEAEMSSPIIPLSETWAGNLGGLDVVARFDPTTQSVQSLVTNTLPQVLCYVQAEPHLKSGTTTVGELGPDVLGHLSPGQSAETSVPVSSEPSLAGVSFDGYVVHLEVFPCSGTGPVPHAPGQGGEGGGGEGAGGEGHGPGGEGSGSESGGESGEGGSGGSEEGSSANQLAPDETFDMVRSGARLILSYDAASNSFKGTVENTTSQILTRVRIEVHLSNGTELGPTTPVDLAPGQVANVTLMSTQAPFTGWVAHAEVGGGEGGGESGSESGGEHGSGGEAGGEHGSGGGGEHGSGGEGRGGG